MAFDVEQLNRQGEIFMDKDVILSPRERDNIIIRALKTDYFVVGHIYSFGKKIITTSVNNTTFAILSKQITYLGNPHDLFKKRIQIPAQWVDIYNDLNKDYEVLFLGVYRYEDNVIFVNFHPENYVQNRINNSSAHVHTNDLYQALKRKVFKKRDKNDNEITCISGNHLTDYLLEWCVGYYDGDHELVHHIKNFNNYFHFNKNIYGYDAYSEMLTNKFNYALQAEWPGFYLEYQFDKFAKQLDIEMVLKYIQYNTPGYKSPFDLWSEKYNFFADLKTSDIGTASIILNDQENILWTLEEHSTLWYLVYQHTTVMDSLLDFRTTKYWNTLLNKDNLMSYSTRMKGMISFQSMFILEINKINYRHLLTDFNQGRNSDGSRRNPKYMVNKRNIDNYIIYKY